MWIHTPTRHLVATGPQRTEAWLCTRCVSAIESKRWVRALMRGGQSLDKEAASGPGSSSAEREPTSRALRRGPRSPDLLLPVLSWAQMACGTLKSPSAKPGPSPQSAHLETPTVSNKNAERMDLRIFLQLVLQMKWTKTLKTKWY